MTATNEVPEQIRFHCCFCGAGLAVPASLAGISGPCPSCFQEIQAPLPELDASQNDPYAGIPECIPEPASGPLFPDLRALPSPVQPIMAGSFESEPKERSFRAKLAIPPVDEPLDDSWKDRHRDLRRSVRRTRKVESVAQNLLESRGFQIARLFLILGSAAMLVFLFQYLRSHQWRFPGLGPGHADGVAAQPAESSARPVGSDVNELAADDDAELPAAAGFIPAADAPGAPRRTPIAAPPR